MGSVGLIRSSYFPSIPRTSTRSLSRPVARLFSIRSANPSTGTVTASNEPSTRFACAVERQARHAGKNIDAIRRKTELDDDVVAREILLTYIQVIKWGTEFRKCAPHPSRILFGRIDPDVDVDR